MLVTLFLAMLLMTAGVGKAAVSDLQVTGKVNDRTLGSRERRQNMKKQLHHQVKNNFLRSLDLESFNIHVSPTSSKISFPTIIRLHPPTLQPPHRHVNMPMRFGRDGSHGDDHNLNSAPNMPQRFGRSWKEMQPCEWCYEAHRVLKRRVKRARNGQSFIRTLFNAQLLKAGLHWA